MILDLLKECTGNNYSNPLCFIFETDASHFKINYNLINPIKGNFPHVGITARAGICVLYFSPTEKTWLNVDVYTRNSSIDVLMSHMIEEGQSYKVMIYGPILSELNMLNIEIPENCYSKIIDSSKNSMSVFGGIHSFGIGCTTVGVMFSNILGRKLNYNVNQITFNERNYLKFLYNHLNNFDSIPHSSIGILELDYYNQDDKIVENYLKDVVALIKEKCDILIGWVAIHPNKSYKINNICEILRDEINNDAVIFENYSHIYNEDYYDMCTFGFHFINDAGNILIFKNLQKKLGELNHGIYE